MYKQSTQEYTYVEGETEVPIYNLISSYRSPPPIMLLTKQLWTPIPNYKSHPMATTYENYQTQSKKKRLEFPQASTLRFPHTEGFCLSISKLLMAQGSASSSMGSSPAQLNDRNSISPPVFKKVLDGFWLLLVPKSTRNQFFYFETLIMYCIIGLHLVGLINRQDGISICWITIATILDFQLPRIITPEKIIQEYCLPTSVSCPTQPWIKLSHLACWIVLSHVLWDKILLQDK